MKKKGKNRLKCALAIIADGIQGCVTPEGVDLAKLREDLPELINKVFSDTSGAPGWNHGTKQHTAHNTLK